VARSLSVQSGRQAQSWAAHFARGRAVAPRSAPRARRSVLPERHPAAHREAGRLAGSAAQRRQRAGLPMAQAAAGAAPLREQVPSFQGRVVVASCPAVSSARRGQRWAMPGASVSDVLACQRLVVEAAQVEVAQQVEEAVSASDALAPRLEEAELQQAGLAALDAPAAPQQAEAAEEVVASDAPAVPRRVAVAAPDAVEVLPRAEAAARDAEVVAAVVGARDAAAQPRAVALDVAAVRGEAAAVRAVAAVQRQEEVPAAAPAPAAAAVPSAAVWVFRQGQLRPAAAPQSAARSVHEMRRLQTASRSARLLQAAQDEVWS